MGESSGLVKRLSYAEIEQISKAFIASGMFGRDMDRTSKAITKVMAGQELGLAPFASMRAVHVIDGNATLSANTMAGMVKVSGRYDYEVKKKDEDECIIDFFEIRNDKRFKVGTEVFSMAEAKTAGLTDKNNWKKYPKSMLFARCISNGARTYCPDVFNGMAVYTPDEFDIDVGSDGSVIEVKEKPVNSDRETKAKEGELVDESDTGTFDEEDQRTDYDNDEQSTTIESEESQGVYADQGDDPGKEVWHEEVDSQESSVDERLETPITQEYMDEALEMFMAIPLKNSSRMSFLKKYVDVITVKSIKADDQWRKLFIACDDYHCGNLELDKDWMEGSTDGTEELESDNR